jgi:hypothetical protein
MAAPQGRNCLERLKRAAEEEMRRSAPPLAGKRPRTDGDDHGELSGPSGRVLVGRFDYSAVEELRSGAVRPAERVVAAGRRPPPPLARTC